MLKCFEGENTSMCEAIRQMVDEGIMLGETKAGKPVKCRRHWLLLVVCLKWATLRNWLLIATMLTKQEVEELSRTIKS